MKISNSVSKYEDIIHLPHHVSPRRPRMPAADRAAQFSPFAALTGHDAAVKETARLTEAWVELDENFKERLNEELQTVKLYLNQRPRIKVTYFNPDIKKEGGEYVTLTGTVKK